MTATPTTADKEEEGPQGRSDDEGFSEKNGTSPLGLKRSRSKKKMRSIKGGSLTSLPLFDGRRAAADTANENPAASSNSRRKKTANATVLGGEPTTAATTSTTTKDPNDVVNAVIRPMNMGDLKNVFLLGNSVFTANEFPNLYRTWDDFSVVECFEGSPEFCFVAVSPMQDKVIGFLLGHVMEKPNVEKRGYIEWVAIHPSHRRKGVATQLLNTFVQKASNMGILRLFADTQSDNLPAKALLHKAGLTFVTDHVYMIHHVSSRSPKSKSVTKTSKRIDSQGWLEYTVSAEMKQQQIPQDKKNEATKSAPTRRTRGGGRSSSANTVKVTIRPMEIHDLHSVWMMGERIFPQSSPNLFHFWDQHLVLQSYLSDPDFCLVATIPVNGHGSHGDSSVPKAKRRKKNEQKRSAKNEEIPQDQDGIQEQVIGFCFGTTIEKPRSRWKYGYLVWLGTSPDYQGLGVASELYTSMKELFVSDHCSILMIDTQSSNAPAIEFFRKKGFGQDEKHVYLSNEAGALVNDPIGSS